MQLKKWFSFLKTSNAKYVIRHKLLLLECKIHGSHYYECISMIKKNQLTQKQPLILKREANNLHDGCAIEVMTENGKKLGYVPQKDNKVIANLIDQKVVVDAYISAINKDAWDPVEIKVMLHAKQ